ncbi:MAG: hypothetical protein OXC71_00100 [Chloroflexi bacterium]|nr:hypothetical protein [Chloroflexota bacterium]
MLLPTQAIVPRRIYYEYLLPPATGQTVVPNGCPVERHFPALVDEQP